MVKRRGFRNLTKVVFVLSLIWISITVSWFFKTKDYSEVVVHCAIGLGAIIVSMIYEMVARIKMDIKELDDALSSMSNWTQQKITQLENINKDLISIKKEIVKNEE